MNEIEKKQNKMYSILFFIARLAMVGLFVYEIMGAFWEGEFTSETIKNLSFFALYLIGTTLLPINKNSMYVETVGIAILTYLFDHDALLGLLLFPISTSMKAKLSKIDVITFPILFLGVLAYSLGWNLTLISIIIGLIVFFYVKETENNYKKDEVKIAKAKLRTVSKELREKEGEIISTEKENETISKMFIRTKKLNEKIEIKELVQELVNAPKSLFNASFVALYAYDEENYKLLKQTGNRKRFDVPKVLNKKQAETPEIENGFLKVPIKFQGNPWGVIYVYEKRESMYRNGQKIKAKFNEEDYEILATYCGQVMFSMKHAQTLVEKDNLANNDFLTGIPNRRCFFDKFNYLLNRAKRGEELALVILDIDHFKKFNDTYGHDKGDEVLKIVAEVLQEYVRNMDFVGRLGGEEFGVLIPNANVHAVEIAERLRRKVSVVPFVETITISLGVAYYGEHGTTIEELNKAADIALYKAKENGRNQVSIYDGTSQMN